jgi:hypothetical protein
MYILFNALFGGKWNICLKEKCFKRELKISASSELLEPKIRQNYLIIFQNNVRQNCIISVGIII